MKNKINTLIGINNLSQVDQLAYSNHMQFFYRLGVYKGSEDSKKKLTPEGGKEVNFALCNPRRMSIDRMRNEAAKVALEGDFDYLMFIDDDVLLPIDAWHRLVEADKDIICGVTHIRGYPYHPMIFNFTDPAYKKNSFVDDYEEKADKESGLLKVDAVGFSCCLIKVDLLKKVIPPFFVTGTHQTEDVFFCKRAAEQVADVSIFAHTWVKTGHLLGTEIIHPESVKFQKEFDEKRYPGIEKTVNPERQDRDPASLLAVLAEK